MRNAEDLRLYVLQEYPREACGLVCDGLFVPCPNLSATPEEAFVIDPAHPLLLSRQATAVVHSHTKTHPDKKYDPRSPSKADMEGQLRTALPWSIVACDGQTVSEPITIGGVRPPLEGRPFVFNANDCLTLATDYYAQERGIVLPVLPRHWDWWLRGETLIDDHWRDWGFTEVSFAEAQVGDAILFRMGTDFTNHIGVLVEQDGVLHHQLGHLSGVADLSRLSRFIYKIIRPKTTG